MTQDKTPTEAAILALLAEKKPMPSLVFLAKDDAKLADVQAAAVAIVRVGLAKWGSPVVAGERPRFPAQKPLGEPFQRVLDENRWELYAEADTQQPTQAQAGAVPQYRLLQSGVDRIEAADEFLSDDTRTWAIDPNGIFVGNIYGGHVLRPARRRIKEGGQHG